MKNVKFVNRLHDIIKDNLCKTWEIGLKNTIIADQIHELFIKKNSNIQLS